MENGHHEDPKWTIYAAFGIIFFIIVGIETSMGILFIDGLRSMEEPLSREISFWGYILRVVVIFLISSVITSVLSWLVYRTYMQDN